MNYNFKNDRFAVVVKVCVFVILFLIFAYFLPRFATPSFATKDIDLLAERADSSIVSDLVSAAGTLSVESDSAYTTLIPKTILSQVDTDSLTPFEDYSSSQDGFANLAKAIAERDKTKRPIRIAFLGDSFIEADILTSDIRERLQQIYGGRGVGFMPIASKAAAYRKTIVHKFNGWKTHSMLGHKGADLAKLMLSAQYFVPSEGATVSFKGTNACKFVDKFNSARFLFVNEKNTTIEIKVNNDSVHQYKPQSSSVLQSIDLAGEIHSIEITLHNVSGFTGFGMLLNDYQGIYVDNFSVRGSSGMVLSIVNKELAEATKLFMTYDMIVLQYGLNVASPSVKNYNGYHKAMIAVINHLKACYPNTDIVVMGVGDRCVRGPKGFETMEGISKMTETQRDLAIQTGTLFWDTYQAMGGSGSMVKFVSNSPPMASKDYTHINYAGGKKIASSFVDAMIYSLSQVKPKTEKNQQ